MAATTGNGDPWQPMTGADPDRLRELGALLRMRRAAIGYRHLPAFARGRGINTRMAGDIEHGRRDTYTHPSLEDVARAYEVTYDSMMDVVWSGAGELVPALAGAPGPPAAERLLPAAPIDDAARTAADKPYADRIWAGLRAWAAKGVTDPTGAQLFGAGTADAQAWDGIGARLPAADRVWFVADLQRLDAARAAGHEVNGTGALTRGRTAVPPAAIAAGYRMQLA